jgi:hypothetical protein
MKRDRKAQQGARNGSWLQEQQSGILAAVMPEESTTAELVELTRKQWEAVKRRDVDIDEARAAAERLARRRS